jgi:hypothetical protein
MTNSNKIIYTGDRIVIIDVSVVLPKHSNYPHGTNVINPATNKPAVSPESKYYDIVSRRIDKVYYHQTAGGYTSGFLGLMNTAEFFIRDPKYKQNKRGEWVWTAEGHGWPGFAYTHYVCFNPPKTEDGKLIIYQTNPLFRVSWHTGDHCNEHGIGIAFQGYFHSRHIANFVPMKGTDGHPSDEQMICAEEFFNGYCKTILHMTNASIDGHFNHGKVTCPGDDLEDFILSVQKSAKGG